MVENRLVGLGIDLFKYIVSIVSLAYAWYLLAVTVRTGVELTQIVVLQETQQIYLYYMILATVAALYYSYNYIMNREFAPTYTNLISRSDLLLAIMFISVFAISSIIRLFSMGLPSIVSTVYQIPLAYIYGILGVVENMFFIGVLGFGLRYLLRERGYRASNLISAIIIGMVAVMWHLYILFTTSLQAGLAQVIIVASSVFLFFFIGTMISLSRDNTWVWDIVHFTVNFMVTLLQSTGYIIIW